MHATTALRQARRRAGRSQRDLAAVTGVSQPTIARIESGRVDPRLRTLDALLAACGETLEALPRAGEGVDRTTIREMLDRSPRERVASLAAEAGVLERLARARRRR